MSNTCDNHIFGESQSEPRIDELNDLVSIKLIDQPQERMANFLIGDFEFCACGFIIWTPLYHNIIKFAD